MIAGGNFIIAKFNGQRAEEDRNLISMGAEAEQSRCRISMGANAAEFQWEPSFLEQKQQACLFLFWVFDIEDIMHKEVRIESPRHAFMQGFQIELY